jgi:hypothetical protein
VLLKRGLADELAGELPEEQLRERLVGQGVAGHRGLPVLDGQHIEQQSLVPGEAADCPAMFFLSPLCVSCVMNVLRAVHPAGIMWRALLWW